MARFKDFDAAEAERKGEPITFRLGGKEWTAAHVGAATFLAFSRQSAEGGPAAMTGFDDYITSTLAEDQREPFHAMLAEHDVQLSTLIALMQWIVEQATGNPTAAVSPSLPSPSNTGKPRVVYSREPRQESTTGDVASVSG